MMKKGFTLANETQKAFTLIELLITIAIVGILSAAVLVGINPVQKLAQANDSKIKSDIGAIAGAAQSYMAGSPTGLYPTSVAVMVASKDLSSTPGTPVNFSALKTSGGAACDATACGVFAVYYALNAPVTAGNVWCYRSATGVASETTAAACAP